MIQQVESSTDIASVGSAMPCGWNLNHGLSIHPKGKADGMGYVCVIIAFGGFDDQLQESRCNVKFSEKETVSSWLI